ncbi:MAG: 50S ribosomal protein L22 [Candidatus Saccharimonadales bacterium]|jgi:large subunit ribosomal protein L22
MAVYVKAQAKGLAMTPRKVGEVANLVRGRSVTDALVILEHTPRRAALPIIKVIKSAQANATHNHNAKGDDLVIDTLNVSPGPRMKRFRPVARGSAHPYQKRTTHVTVIVSGAEKAKKPTTTKSTTKTTKKESK